jgi:DNA repair ATPase RecN
VLDKKGRVEELVRMTAGEHVTKAAEENAAALLKAANSFKKKNAATLFE